MDGTKGPEAVLRQISKNPHVTIDELVTLTGISRRQISRHIKQLIEDEIITRDGGKRFGKWIVLKEL